MCPRFLKLALTDQALQMEQRLPDGSIRRRGIAEDDLGLLEHSLGRQCPRAPGISVREGVPPFRTGILLDEPLEKFDRILESPEPQGVRCSVGERGCGNLRGAIELQAFGHADRASLWSRLKLCRAAPGVADQSMSLAGADALRRSLPILARRGFCHRRLALSIHRCG